VLAQRQGCLVAQVLAAFDHDPDAFLTEVALVQLEVARTEAQRVHALKVTERAGAMRKLRISADFVDRLTLALVNDLRRSTRARP
jgi:hypothetical protein